MHKALSIPEVLAHVFSFLNKGDLIHCAIVSRAWSTVAHSCLWKTISFSDLAWGVPVDLFRQNAHLVARLHMTSTQQFQAYAVHCTGLHHLVFPADHHHGLSDSDVVALVQQNKSTLRSLEMRLLHTQPSTLVQAIAGVHRLTHLRLTIHLYLESLSKYLKQLLQTCPSLKSLDLDGVGQSRQTRAHDDDEMSWGGWSAVNKHQRGYTLRELSLSFPSCGDGYAFLIPLLEQCRDLVHLQLPSIPVHIEPGLCQFLKAKAIPVESLDLSMAIFLKDPEIARLFSACQPNTLKSLDLGRREIGPLTLTAILTRHRQSIERLHMMDIRCSGSAVVMAMSPWIHAVLSTCPRLASFKIYASSMDFVYLSADHILQDDEGAQESSMGGIQDWACAQTLRELRVPIGGLCQPKSQWGWTPCKSQDHDGICLNKHARVFERLGTLSKLEKLDVTRSVHGPTLPDWLEWRLAYGLGHLGSLTRLQELAIPRHSVLGREEIEWMRVPWPRCLFIFR